MSVWIQLPPPSHSDAVVGDSRSHCSFCHRPLGPLTRLIHAGDVSICVACVRASANLLRAHNIPGWHPWWRFWGATGLGEPPTGRGYRDQPLACTFCRHTLAEVPALLGDARTSICSTCVRLCLDILRENPGSGSIAAVPPGAPPGRPAP